MYVWLFGFPYFPLFPSYCPIALLLICKCHHSTLYLIDSANSLHHPPHRILGESPIHPSTEAIHQDQQSPRRSPCVHTRCYCTPSGPSLLYAHNYSNCVAGPTFSRHHHRPETASSQPKCLDCSLNCLQCRRAAKGGPRM